MNTIHPSHPFYFLDSRKERLRKYPLRALFLALVRRVLYFLEYIRFIPKQITTNTFWGAPVQGPVALVFPLLEKGFFEGEEMRLTNYMIQTLKQGDVVIDGGALIGWYSLLARDLGADVHSFEPTPRSFRTLQENVRGTVMTNNVALWSEDGCVLFNDIPGHDAENSVSDARRVTDQILVESVTLDTYCYSKEIKPTFIKLDCEGAELEILKGARHTLEYHPILAIEVLRETIESGMYTHIKELLKDYTPYQITNEFTLEPFNPSPEKEVHNVIFLWQ